MIRPGPCRPPRSVITKARVLHKTICNPKKAEADQHLSLLRKPMGRCSGHHRVQQTGRQADPLAGLRTWELPPSHKMQTTALQSQEGTKGVYTCPHQATHHRRKQGPTKKSLDTQKASKLIFKGTGTRWVCLPGLAEGCLASSASSLSPVHFGELSRIPFA